MLSSLKFGELNYTKNNQKTYFAINAGFVEVTAEKVIVLVETAEQSDVIDKNRAKKAKEIAEEKLAKLTKDDPEYEKVKKALDRAEIRLRIADKAS